MVVTTRLVADATALIPGIALTSHAVIDEHCPGAHGNPQPSCWPNPPQS